MMFWSRKELKKILDNCTYIYKIFKYGQEIPQSHLMLHKMTGRNINKILQQNRRKNTYNFESPQFITLKRGQITNVIPKKMYKYLENSKNFYRVYFKNHIEIYMPLNFATCYEKIYVNTDDFGNTTEWYLVLSNDESNIAQYDSLSKYNSHLFQLIDDNHIEIFLECLEKARPEFANEIRLYLEVN